MSLVEVSKSAIHSQSMQILDVAFVAEHDRDCFFRDSTSKSVLGSLKLHRNLTIKTQNIDSQSWFTNGLFHLPLQVRHSNFGK